MSNFELQEKAVKAAARFIERKGFELLETGWTSPEGTRIDLIANDEDTLVFIDVTATEYSEGGFEGGKVKRGDLEIAAASWLAGNSPDGEIQVRFDIIDMLVVSADRALLRHHINAFSCGVGIDRISRSVNFVTSNRILSRNRCNSNEGEEA